MTRVSESVKKELLEYPYVTAVGHGEKLKSYLPMQE